MTVFLPYQLLKGPILLRVTELAWSWCQSRQTGTGTRTGTPEKYYQYNDNLVFIKGSRSLLLLHKRY